MKCDAKKFARMYEGVYKDLYRFSLCRMKNVQDAEDAVSEAVLAGYEKIYQLRTEAAFKSWIFAILANVCRKRLEESEGRRRKEEELDACEPKTSGTDVDYGVAVDVKNAFSILSAEEQEIVALSVFGGYSSKEIGNRMKLNPNTVRSKLSRALKKMEYVLK